MTRSAIASFRYSRSMYDFSSPLLSSLNDTFDYKYIGTSPSPTSSIITHRKSFFTFQSSRSRTAFSSLRFLEILSSRTSKSFIMVCPTIPSALQHLDEIPPFGNEPLAFPGTFPGVPGIREIPVSDSPQPHESLLTFLDGWSEMSNLREEGPGSLGHPRQSLWLLRNRLQLDWKGKHQVTCSSYLQETILMNHLRCHELCLKMWTRVMEFSVGLWDYLAL